MKKILISSILMLGSAYAFADTIADKDAMYCYSMPQKAGVYMCKTWDELSASQADDNNSAMQMKNSDNKKITKVIVSVPVSADKKLSEHIEQVKVPTAVSAAKEKTVSQSVKTQSVAAPEQKSQAKILKKEADTAEVSSNSKPSTTKVDPNNSSASNKDKIWMVQVALASNQDNADRMIKNLKSKGYNTTKTTTTTKGVRVLVGPNDYETAHNIKTKIQSDQSLNAESAWLLNWEKAIKQ